MEENCDVLQQQGEHHKVGKNEQPRKEARKEHKKFRISKGQTRPPVQNCPRCHSTNTKFCYYNNYSLAQPRHYCKSCKRFWTHGGALRDIPVGGGSRKDKRSTKRPSHSVDSRNEPLQAATTFCPSSLLNQETDAWPIYTAPKPSTHIHVSNASSTCPAIPSVNQSCKGSAFTTLGGGSLSDELRPQPSGLKQQPQQGQIHQKKSFDVGVNNSSIQLFPAESNRFPISPPPPHTTYCGLAACFQHYY